jgi:hypothetical protein
MFLPLSQLSFDVKLDYYQEDVGRSSVVEKMHHLAHTEIDRY